MTSRYGVLESPKQEAMQLASELAQVVAQSAAALNSLVIRSVPNFPEWIAPQEMSPPKCSHWQSSHNAEMGCHARHGTCGSMPCTAPARGQLLTPRDWNSAFELLQQQEQQQQQLLTPRDW